MKQTRYAVPALEKGLDILETLANARVSQSLAELAKSLKRNPNELFRMLSCLEGRGYLAKDPASAQYALTLRLFELAHTHSPIEKVLAAAKQPMAQLTATIRESCHLSILRRDDLLVIAQAEKPGITRLSVEVGATFDPLHTASGRLLLAFLPEEELSRVFNGTAANRPMIRKRLAQIRMEGVSTAESESFVGIHDVSVLVGNPGIRLTAALAVAFLQRSRRGGPPTIHPEEIKRHLHSTAAEINRNLQIKGTL